jgi:hypothetical protein
VVLYDALANEELLSYALSVLENICWKKKRMPRLRKTNQPIVDNA